jgi:hypothetical protein
LRTERAPGKGRLGPPPVCLEGYADQSINRKSL